MAYCFEVFFPTLPCCREAVHPPFTSRPSCHCLTVQDSEPLKRPLGYLPPFLFWYCQLQTAFPIVSPIEPSPLPDLLPLIFYRSARCRTFPRRVFLPLYLISSLMFLSAMKSLSFSPLYSDRHHFLHLAQSFHPSYAHAPLRPAFFHQPSFLHPLRAIHSP